MELIMIKSINFDSDSGLILVNLNNNLFENAYVSSEKVYEISANIDEFFLDSLNENVYVLKPIKNGDEFIVEFICINHRKTLGIKDLSDVRGRLFSDILPDWKEIFYPVLKETYLEKTESLIKVIVNSDNIIDDFTLIRCSFSKGLIYLIFEEEEKYFENKRKELQNDTVVYSDSSKSAVSYLDENNIHFWSKGCYQLLECPLSESDIYNDIFYEYVLEEDKKDYSSFKENLINGKSEDFLVYRIKTPTGVIKYIGDYSKSIYDKDKNKLSRMAIRQDISDRKTQMVDVDIFNLLTQIESKTNFAFLIWNRNGGYLVTDEFYKIIGFNEDDSKIPVTHILFTDNIIIEDDGIDFEEEMKKFYDGLVDEIDITFKFKQLNKTGAIKTFNLYLKSISDIQKVGILFDITDQLLKEEKLSEAYHEKKLLLDELRHRVKNNLQVLKSFIHLEEHFNEGEYHNILEATKSRIDSIAQIHEKSYVHGDYFTVDVNEFVNDIAESLLDLFDSKVNINISVQEGISLDIDKITSLALMINEFTMNSLKYAFPDSIIDKNNNIDIKVEIINDTCIFTYKDNGIGLPESFTYGLGMTIVKALTTQLDGKMEAITSDGVGAKISFPID